MKENIRFGIVGYGAIGKRHKEKIDGNPKAECVAIADINRGQLDGLDNGSIQLFTDYHEILKLKNVDVVSVCTPNFLHAPMTIDALQARKNVLCEKPMALTAKDCKMMVHASLRENRKLFIVKQNRYNPPVVAIKELMKAKKMGRIYSIVLNCYWNRNDNYYNKSDWKGLRAKDGGALFTQFSHFVDLMLWFGGGVSSVYTLAQNYNHPNIDIEDAGIVALKFDDGTIGSINFTNNSYAKNMEGSITIFAEKGTVKIGGQYLNELEYQVIEDGEIKNLDTSAKANDYGTYQGSMSNHDKVYENVVDSLTNGGKVAVNGIEGMLTVEMIEAAYKSMESGAPVFL